MIYLELQEVLRMHDAIIASSGGLNGIRDLGGLESSITQPQMVMFGKELYPTVIEKAAMLGFSIITNHPFLDGNKRIGHAAMEVFLMLNGYEIETSIDDQESTILELASGNLSKEEFTTWLKTRTINLPPSNY